MQHFVLMYSQSMRLKMSEVRRRAVLQEHATRRLLQGMPEVALHAQEEACTADAFQACKTLVSALGRDQEVQGRFLIHVVTVARFSWKFRLPGFRW